MKGPQESQSSCQDSSKRCSNVRKPCLEPQVVPQREEVRFVADPPRRSTIGCKCLWLKWHTFATWSPRQRQQIVLLSLGGYQLSRKHQQHIELFNLRMPFESKTISWTTSSLCSCNQHANILQVINEGSKQSHTHTHTHTLLCPCVPLASLGTADSGWCWMRAWLV